MLQLLKKTLFSFHCKDTRRTFHCPDNDLVYEYIEQIQLPLKIVALSTEHSDYVMMVGYVRASPVSDVEWNDIEKGSIEHLTQWFHLHQVRDGWLYSINSLVHVKEPFMDRLQQIAVEWEAHFG
jgi:hypothetical protein